MAELSCNGGGGWKWYFTISEQDIDINTYRINISGYVKGDSSFSLDLMQNDIWWDFSFDGDPKEVFRVKLANGRYQTLSANTKYGNFTFSKDYTKTTSSQSKSPSFSVWGSATVATNLLGTTSSGTYDFTIPAGYQEPSDFNISISNVTTNSFSVTPTWTDGVNNNISVSIIVNGVTETTTSKTAISFTNLTSNTNYPISATLTDSNNPDGTFKLTASAQQLTELVGNLSLSLYYRSEYNTINAEASNNSNYEYKFKLGNNAWSNYSSSNKFSYFNLSPNTSYTIYMKMKNTISGYESDEISKSITTWHYPLYNLRVNLKDRWFWYLEINSSYTYTGSIKKYEFAIGNEDDPDTWHQTVDNSYSRGTKDIKDYSIESRKLKYNNDYICSVKITDNHDRVYEVSQSFKTFDERPLYVNGELREVKLIRANQPIIPITPDKLSIIQKDNIISIQNIINRIPNSSSSSASFTNLKCDENIFCSDDLIIVEEIYSYANEEEEEITE